MSKHFERTNFIEFNYCVKLLLKHKHFTVKRPENLLETKGKTEITLTRDLRTSEPDFVPTRKTGVLNAV